MEKINKKLEELNNLKKSCKTKKELYSKIKEAYTTRLHDGLGLLVDDNYYCLGDDSCSLEEIKAAGVSCHKAELLKSYECVESLQSFLSKNDYEFFQDEDEDWWVVETSPLAITA